MMRVAALSANALLLAGCEIERVACCQNPAVLMDNSCLGSEAACNLARVEHEFEQLQATREALLAPDAVFSCLREIPSGQTASEAVTPEDCRESSLQNLNAMIAELEKQRDRARDFANQRGQ